MAGAALGDDPVGAVAEIAVRVLPLVDQQDGTGIVTTVVGGMRLSDYLPTRTFELVVHTCDLARALGVAADVPAEPAAHALALVGETAAGTEAAVPLILAATGRTGLPDGFTIL